MAASTVIEMQKDRGPLLQDPGLAPASPGPAPVNPLLDGKLDMQDVKEVVKETGQVVQRLIAILPRDGTAFDWRARLAKYVPSGTYVLFSLASNVPDTVLNRGYLANHFSARERQRITYWVLVSLGLFVAFISSFIKKLPRLPEGYVYPIPAARVLFDYWFVFTFPVFMHGFISSMCFVGLTLGSENTASVLFPDAPQKYFLIGQYVFTAFTFVLALFVADDIPTHGTVNVNKAAEPAIEESAKVAAQQAADQVAEVAKKAVVEQAKLADASYTQLLKEQSKGAPVSMGSFIDVYHALMNQARHVTGTDVPTAQFPVGSAAAPGVGGKPPVEGASQPSTAAAAPTILDSAAANLLQDITPTPVPADPSTAAAATPPAATTATAAPASAPTTAPPSGGGSGLLGSLLHAVIPGTGGGGSSAQPGGATATAAPPPVAASSAFVPPILTMPGASTAPAGGSAHAGTFTGALALAEAALELVTQAAKNAPGNRDMIKTAVKDGEQSIPTRTVSIRRADSVTGKRFC